MSNPAPVYLFTGGAHVGKATVAQWFATGLLCLGENRPCGKCTGCQQIQNNVHPDYYSVDVAEDKRDISVEQVHELRQWLSQTSLLGGRRVAIIKTADRLSLPAANATLKLLEESSASAVVLLVSESVEALPATVVSRCQIIRLQPVTSRQISEALAQLGATAQVAERLASASYGQPGLAFTWLADPQQLEDYQRSLAQLASMFARPTVAWDAIERVTNAATAAEIYQQISQAQVLIHEAVRQKAGVGQALAAPNNVVLELASRPWPTLTSLWTSLAEIGQTIGSNVNIRVALEAANLKSNLYD
jgi:DNA polymerase-3 subunit delta'